MLGHEYAKISPQILQIKKKKKKRKDGKKKESPIVLGESVRRVGCDFHARSTRPIALIGFCA